MSFNNLTIKDLPVSERPYEKLESMGPQALSDAELIAIILRTGTRRERATDLAIRLLMHAPGDEQRPALQRLFMMSLSQMQEVDGIGRVKAIQLSAVMELSKRISMQRALSHFKATDPESVAETYMESMRYLPQEIVKLVMLNQQNDLIGEQNISLGTANQAILSVRDIFSTALDRKAVNLILLHNHPSGDPSPSMEDLMTTRRLIRAGMLMEIEVLDHIIIGDGKYYSMKEQGVLDAIPDEEFMC